MTVSRGTGVTTGTTTYDNYDSNNVDINGGTIDGTIIGSATPRAGTFSDLTATNISFTGGTISGTSQTSGSIDGVTIGATSAPTVTNIDINGGSIDGVTIGAAAAPTVTNLGSVTTCDINGGTIDGVTIGAAVAPTVTSIDINGGSIDGVTIGAAVAPTVTNIDINGGSVDGATIGSSSASTGAFTTLSASTRTDATTLRHVTPSTSGTDTYTVTTGFGALTTGEVICVNFATTNTSTTPTLNRDSLGAKTIVNKDGKAVTVGELTGAVHLRYDGTYYRTLDTIPVGTVIQTVYTQTGAVATGTTVMVYDDTIPQNTEGDEYMTLSITPKYSTSILIIQANVNLSHSSTNTNMCAALFQDTTADALAAAWAGRAGTASARTEVVLRHTKVSGTTSSTTFKIRAGTNSAGTTTFNGTGGARELGGVLASGITITEIKA